MLLDFKSELDNIVYWYTKFKAESALPDLYKNAKRANYVFSQLKYLEPLANLWETYLTIFELLEENSDPDLEKELINTEKEILYAIKRLSTLTNNLIIELHAGEGGDEAALFVEELFSMYSCYCEANNIKVEVLTSSETDLGGYREITFSVSGKKAYLLANESGTHRVQRVSKTDSKGRKHTSAATVAVLPEISELNIDLKDEDCKEEVTCAGGPGGQHQNRKATQVKLIHIPTGISAVAREKDQHQNRKIAKRVLKARLYDYYKAIEDENRAKTKKEQIANSGRSSKVRTYNWQQNRVTDHRTNKDYPLNTILVGKLDCLLADLNAFFSIRVLSSLQFIE